MNNRIPILTYHSIDESGSVISTTAHKFRRQMQVLKNKQFNTISINDLIFYIQKNKPLPEKTVVITFDDGFKSVRTIAYPILKEFDFTATVFLVAGYCGKTNSWDGQPNGIPIFNLLEWEDIREMADTGIEFGAHTMTHANLAELPENQVRLEIADSQSFIQNNIERDVQFFAYPYGRYIETTKQFVKKR